MISQYTQAEEVQPEDFETQDSSGFIGGALAGAFEDGSIKIKDVANNVYEDMKTDYNSILKYDFSNPINIDTFLDTEIGKRFENNLSGMEGSPTYDSFVSRAEDSGIRNPVSTAVSLNQCYESALGNEEAITDLYNGIVALDNGLTTAVDKASKLSSTLKLLTTEDQSSLLFQLFTIYVDQKNEETSTTIDSSKVLTPECIDAFNKFSVSADNAKAILQGEMVNCKNFNSDVVDLTLCTTEPTTILRQDNTATGAQIYYNVTGYLNNNGPKLCNITFYVHNLDQAIEYSPEWLPFYDDAHPEGFPSSSSVDIWALVPADSVEPTLPYLDVVNTFYVCDTPQEMPAPIDEKIEEDFSATENELVDPMEGNTSLEAPITNTGDKATSNNQGVVSTSCFTTVECIREISSLVDDTCASYSTLLRSNCHTCSTATMKNAKQECKDAGCSAQQCALATDLSSPAASLTTTLNIFAVALVSIFVFIHVI